jgi:hypothetical protein
MARRVLTAVRFHTIAVILALAAAYVPAHASETDAVDCSAGAKAALPASRMKEVMAFRQQVTSGPFFKELVRRHGKPSTCQIGINENNLTLTYSFGEKALLEARSNSTIESSEQRLQLRGLTEPQAMGLLKKSEKNAFGDNGCPIDWQHVAEDSQGKEPGSHEVVYRGDTCNCQGRLVYEKRALVALVIRSAC